MARLDRSKSFGTVTGIASHRYEQDGRLFDQDGNQVGGEPDVAKPETAKAKPGKVAKAESDQVDQQLNG